MSVEAINAKKVVVEEIAGKFNDSQSTVVVEYRGLSVAEVTELRKSLREEDVEFKVYKNKLVQRATESAGYAEINDKLCEAIESGNYDFIRTNYPNGDMVGHTGSLPATIIGVESVDLELARVIESVNKVNGILLVTADHGNADDESKTSHTLAPVPFIVYNAECELKEGEDLGLSNVAATVCDFLGLEPNEHWNQSLKK